MAISGCIQFFFLIWWDVLTFSWPTIYWWLLGSLRRTFPPNIIICFLLEFSYIRCFDLKQNKTQNKNPTLNCFCSDISDGAGLVLRLLRASHDTLSDPRVLTTGILSSGGRQHRWKISGGNFTAVKWRASYQYELKINFILKRFPHFVQKWVSQYAWALLAVRRWFSKTPFHWKEPGHLGEAADFRSREGLVHKRLGHLLGLDSNRALRDTKASGTVRSEGLRRSSEDVPSSQRWDKWNIR